MRRDVFLVGLLGTLAGALIGLLLVPNPRTKKLPVPFRKGDIVPLFRHRS
ncbi:MAG: hypothetical protein ACM3YO_02610 [Bacteroidota bacterium]